MSFLKMNFASTQFTVVLTFLLWTALNSNAYGQKTPPIGKCEEVRDSEAKKSRTAPVVFGKPYVVPELKLRFLDELTGEPLVNNKVCFHYMWTWFDFLDKFEGRTGTTREAGDLFICETDENGVVFLPERTVETVGYNKGKKRFFRMNVKPKFDHIEFNIHLKEHITSFQYSKKEIDRIRQEKPEYLTLSVSKISPLK